MYVSVSVPIFIHLLCSSRRILMKLPFFCKQASFVLMCLLAAGNWMSQFTQFIIHQSVWMLTFRSLQCFCACVCVCKGADNQTKNRRHYSIRASCLWSGDGEKVIHSSTHSVWMQCCDWFNWYISLNCVCVCVRQKLTHKLSSCRSCACVLFVSGC